MSNFIQVHVDGHPRLINLDNVVIVKRNSEGNTVIDFIHKTAVGPAWLVVDESYDEMKMKIWK